MHQKTKKNAKTRTAVLIILCAVLVVGFTVTLLPYIERYEKQKESQQVISDFQEQKDTYREDAGIQNSPEAVEETTNADYLPELRQIMESYNEDIFRNGQSDLENAWSYKVEPFDLTQYGVTDGVIGLVSIPKIDAEMPMYLGASYSNLLQGCAVLTQTSMPIGGENTNCVIAAHRGWNEIPFVRDIEKVEIGDSIFVENLWETMEYRVTEIRIIYPYEYENILIQPGKDMVTILTCHPYRVNSHRYLVYAERYYENADAKNQAVDSFNKTTPVTVSSGIEFESSETEIFVFSELPFILLILIAILLVAVFTANLIPIIKKKKKRSTQNNP